jgi:hypothetical protein
MSRAQLTTAIKARGGDVANSVTGKVTHLLSTPVEVTGNTSKVILAQGKNVPIVAEGFLDACKKAKKLVDVKKFEIGGGPAKKAAAKKAPAKKAPAKKKAAPKKAAAEGPAADAQQVVPELASEPSMVLGDGTDGAGDTQLVNPKGAAFIAAHPDWLVTSEEDGHRIKISNIRTGALVCKFGKRGKKQGQFAFPNGVAVTSDSSFVLVVDSHNHRVQVLRLVVDGSSAHLEFHCCLGSGRKSVDGELSYPDDVALLQSNGGQQETVLVTEVENHRVSQFALDGTFIGIFAGTSKAGSGDGEFNHLQGITVLGSSGEVAIADGHNYRVQVFDSEGNYKRQFGTKGEDADGQFDCPSGLASDAHGNLLVADWTNRLQVFRPDGKHLCTRSDLGLHGESVKGIAWRADGDIAVANGEANNACVWFIAQLV